MSRARMCNVHVRLFILSSLFVFMISSFRLSSRLEQAFIKLISNRALHFQAFLTAQFISPLGQELFKKINRQTKLLKFKARVTACGLKLCFVSYCSKGSSICQGQDTLCERCADDQASTHSWSVSKSYWGRSSPTFLIDMLFYSLCQLFIRTNFGPVFVLLVKLYDYPVFSYFFPSSFFFLFLYGTLFIGGLEDYCTQLQIDPNKLTVA